VEQEVTEQWQPGKVTHNIKHGFTYLAATDLLAPHQHNITPNTSMTRNAFRSKRAQKLKDKLTSLARKAKQRRDDRNAFTTMMLDSGASSHFNKVDDNLPVANHNIKHVKTASGEMHTTLGQAELPLPQLNKAARVTNILPALKQDSLMSVKTLSDNGYTTVFYPYDRGAEVHSDDTISFDFKNKAHLKAWRDIKGMWQVTIPRTQTITTAVNEVANNVYELPSTQQAIKFLHAALGFPPKSTLNKAINNGNLSTFPGLTVESVNKFFPESDETQKGHMKQTRQNVRSTRTKQVEQADHLPTPGIKHHDAYIFTYDATKKSMYTDQTGRFPITSSRGNKYISWLLSN